MLTRTLREAMRQDTPSHGCMAARGRDCIACGRKAERVAPFVTRAMAGVLPVKEMTHA